MNEQHMWNEPSEEVNEVSRKTVNAAFTVHQYLGPGLLENVYETCLVYELQEQGLKVESQVSVPIHYKKIVINSNLRVDLIVEDKLLVELKTVETVLPVHKAQLMTYMKLTGKQLGLLINFNNALFKDGVHRLIMNKWTNRQSEVDDKNCT